MKGLHEQGKIVRDIMLISPSLKRAIYSYHSFSLFQDRGFKGLYQHFGITKGEKRAYPISILES